MQLRRLASLLPSLVLVACSGDLDPRSDQVPDAGAGHAPSYFYLDQERPLTLDRERVALRAPAGESALLEALAAEGLGGVEVARHPIPGWWLAEVPAGRAAADVARSLGRGPVFASPVLWNEEGNPLIVSPEVLVGLDRNLDAAEAEAVLADFPGVVLESDWAGMPRAYRLRCAAGDGLAVLAAANALAVHPSVVFAEPDFLITGRGGEVPDDPRFADLWGLHNVGQYAAGTPDMDMDAPEAWDITWGDPGVTVMVIDTGVQQDHPDLNLVPGADFTSQGPGDGGPVETCDNHGTLVAGCVSAMANNGLGVVGIAPGCRVFSARAMISTCSGWTGQASWTVDALAHAESLGVRVTNNSNGYGNPSGALTTKYADTRAAGMVHFACAGNSSSSQVWYPASLPTVHAVAALRWEGARAPYSNFGPELSYAAPGTLIYTTDRTGPDGIGDADYVRATGTSFASPYAAGVAALLLSVAPGLDPDGVDALMRQGAADLGPHGFDTETGWGGVRAAATLRAALGIVQPSGPDAGGELASANPALSSDGRVIAFDSAAGDLVAGDDNGFRDVFVHDLDAGTIERVSQSSIGGDANGHSYSPSLSADGRYVAFLSDASDLVAGDLAGFRDAFVHDRVSGVTERVSVKPNGVEANGDTWQVALSGDGTRVAFSTTAYNLASSDGGPNFDVYVRDWVAGTQAVHASASWQGGASDGRSVHGVLSFDGQRVAFQSGATNLVSGGDANGGILDVFVHDLGTGITTRVSDGPSGQGDDFSWFPTISADGQVVAFTSLATNLDAGDTNDESDVFVVDLAAVGAPQRVSGGTGGSFAQGLSADGQVVVFDSWAGDLVPGDTNLAFDVFVHDRAAGTTERQSLSGDGQQGERDSAQARLAGAGVVTFSSAARDLVPGDLNEAIDVFQRDSGGGTTVRVSLED